MAVVKGRYCNCNLRCRAIVASLVLIVFLDIYSISSSWRLTRNIPILTNTDESSFLNGPQQHRHNVSLQQTQNDTSIGTQQQQQQQREFIRRHYSNGYQNHALSHPGRRINIYQQHYNNKTIQTQEERIIMITYVFGEKAANKGYLQMFIESARGSGIDIAIVGSPPPPFPLPPNVKHFHITWDEFVQRVSERLFQGRELSKLRNAHPYKIVDFKPLIAFLFPEIVQNYDFWGHVDNDLVLGNVRRFITHDMLSNQDIISTFPSIVKHVTDRKIIWGPFTIFRNDNVTNHLFLLSALPLEQVLNTDYVHQFDESGQTSQYNASMSGIINQHGDRLGVRWRGRRRIAYGSDYTCDREEENDDTVGNSSHSVQRSCFDCLLIMSPRGGRVQKLIRKDPRRDREVLLCHFIYGKAQSEASLADPTVRERIINDGRLRLTLQGYAPVYDDRKGN